MNITFLGGTGFVGSNLVNQLSNTENNLTILTRSREKNKNMLVYPKVKLVETDVHNADELTKHTKNSDVLINLIGILNEKATVVKDLKRHIVILLE